MPRIYKKKLGPRGKCNYNKQYLERAVLAVRHGRMSMRQASEQYGIPYTTINRRYHGKNPLKYGRQPALSDMQESQLKEVLQICAEWGFPLKSTDIRYIVQQYLTALGVTEKRFNDNLPGMDWFKGFMKRHRDLTIKLAENTKRVRAGVSYEVIQEYFENLRRTVQGVPPSHIINYDETNFVDDPGSVKVVVKRGTKHAHRTIDASKTCTTVMFAIAADGTLLPPYVVYRAKHTYEGWTEGGLEGTRYNRSPSGWFDSTLFEDWFKTVALPYFRNLDGHKVLIGDNLNSHVTVSVIEDCEKHNIKFVLLPPNSTHLLQPLDVAYFHPLKVSWRKILEEWKLKNRGVLPKTLFPRMLKRAIEDISIRSQQNSIAGFKACGIVPLNPDAVLKKIPRKTNEEANEESRTAWTNTIVEHLDRLKVGTSQAAKRGKKNNIVAGKSVASVDLLSTLIEESPPSTPPQSLSLSLSPSSSPAESETDEPMYGSEELEPPVSSELCVGDFIIAKFETNRRDRSFVSKIITVQKSECTVSVLRKKTSNKSNYFVYPINPDITVITHEQVVKKINLSCIKRGKHYFANRNIDFDALD